MQETMRAAASVRQSEYHGLPASLVHCCGACLWTR
jgi:hypothetical protein